MAVLCPEKAETGFASDLSFLWRIDGITFMCNCPENYVIDWFRLYFIFLGCIKGQPFVFDCPEKLRHSNTSFP